MIIASVFPSQTSPVMIPEIGKDLTALLAAIKVGLQSSDPLLVHACGSNIRADYEALERKVPSQPRRYLRGMSGL